MAEETNIKPIEEITSNLDFSGLNNAIEGLSSALSTDSLQSQPEFNLQPTSTPVNNRAVDEFQTTLAADAGSRRDNFAQQLEQNKATASAATETSFDDFLNSVLEAPTFSEIQTQEFDRSGVDNKQLRVNQLDTQLVAEQARLQRELERIEKNPQGGLASGVAIELARAERQSIRKQADIALLQLAAQDQLEFATNVANRAVNAMFERQQKIENVRREIFEQNKEIFTRAEQRAFEVSLNDRERALNAEMAAEQDLRETQIEVLKQAQLNEAPDSVTAAILQSSSPEEAIVAAGRFGSDLLERRHKEAQIANIFDQINSRGLDEYIKLRNLELAEKKLEIDATGAATKKKELTAGERKSLGFAQRMSDSDKTIDELGAKFASLRFLGADKLPNFLKSADMQRYEQAQRNFVNAVLRDESGAVISDQEFDSARKQYFPQPGDSDAVIKQKKENRLRSISNLLEAGGETLGLGTDKQQVYEVNGVRYVQAEDGLFYPQ